MFFLDVELSFFVYPKSNSEAITSFKNKQTLEEKIEVPSLKCPVSAGKVISNNDVEMISIPKPRVTGSTIIDLNEVIGKTARHNGVRAGQPINQFDLQQPILVRKGDVVEITYETPHMRIQHRGIAQKEGRLKETIPVEPLGSDPKIKKTIYARVFMEGGVSVS